MEIKIIILYTENKQEYHNTQQLDLMLQPWKLQIQNVDNTVDELK